MTGPLDSGIVRVLTDNTSGLTATQIADLLQVSVGQVRPRMSIMKRAGIVREVSKGPKPVRGRAPAIWGLVSHV